MCEQLIYFYYLQIHLNVLIQICFIVYDDYDTIYLFFC